MSAFAGWDRSSESASTALPISSQASAASSAFPPSSPLNCPLPGSSSAPDAPPTSLKPFAFAASSAAAPFSPSGPSELAYPSATPSAPATPFSRFAAGDPSSVMDPPDRRPFAVSLEAHAHFGMHQQEHGMHSPVALGRKRPICSPTQHHARRHLVSSACSSERHSARRSRAAKGRSCDDREHGGDDHHDREGDADDDEEDDDQDMMLLSSPENSSQSPPSSGRLSLPSTLSSSQMDSVLRKRRSKASSATLHDSWCAQDERTSTDSHRGEEMFDDQDRHSSLHRKRLCSARVARHLEHGGAHAHRPHLTQPIASSSSATKRLFSELKQFVGSSGPVMRGVRVSPMYENLYQWQIELNNFHQNSFIAQDLQKTTFGMVLLQAIFSPNYPQEPPFVRVVRPRFLRHTSSVSANGTVCLNNVLYWTSSCTMVDLLRCFCEQLELGGARVNLDNTGDYPNSEVERIYLKFAEHTH